MVRRLLFLIFAGWTTAYASVTRGVYGGVSGGVNNQLSTFASSSLLNNSNKVVTNNLNWLARVNLG